MSLKTLFSNPPHAVLLLISALSISVPAQTLQLVSTHDPGQSPPAGGSGDSWAPILSPDGRFVLFASSANNLLFATNNRPIPALLPAPLNVFLRDRTNGTTTLVSVNLSGVAGGNGNSLPVNLSTNGRYALFESSASDLVANDTNNCTDIFLRDLLNGTTTLVSVSTNGAVGNGESRSAAMTPDARYVAFVSAANNLVAGDTNGIPDIFVRDLQAATTTLASVGATSAKLTALFNSSEAPTITPDGRYVAFYSTATNLVPAVQTTSDIYVRDLVGGTAIWASTGARALVSSVLQVSNALCYNHTLSDDGQFVAYQASPGAGTGYPGLILRYNLSSGTTDLVHTNATVSGGPYEDIRSLDMSPDSRFIAFIANTNGTQANTTCVQLWDAQTGISTLVSGDTNNLVPANSICHWPTLDPSGRFVAFISTATNLTTNMLTGDFHVYVRDTLAGATVLADADTNGIGSLISPATIPSLSADGRFVAFDCRDANLVPNDSNRDSDVFVRDLTTGGCELISARDPALASSSPNGASGSAASSADGRFVAFTSDADNLVSGDTNGCRDVFVRDMATTSTVLVSVGTNGLSGDNLSTEPALSADGRYVAFSSSADNLVPGDTNRAQDVFLRDLQAGTTTLISLNSAGTAPANGASYSPVISTDGRFILFRSKATNLAPGSFSGTENLFLRDRPRRATYALTTSGLSSAAMTPDGHFVAFVDPNGASFGTFYIWDSLAAARVYTGTTVFGLRNIAISPDGNRLAYWAGSGVVQLYALDRAANTNWAIISGPGPTPRPTLRFSRNNQGLTYNKLLTGTNQVYLYDFQTGANLLASHTYDSAGPASLSSDSPDISADGRFVAYRSAATNLVAGDTNSVRDIFLFDRQTGSNTLLTANRFTGSGGDIWSMAPLFSADGQTLLFQSWSSDLLAQDFNHNADVFAFTLLYVSLLRDAGPGQGPWVSWPVVPGKSYRVQFKDNLADSAWQDLSVSPTNSGTKAFLQDPAPDAARRFYRIRAY